MDPLPALGRCALFSALDRRALRALCTAAQPVELKGGACLFRAGEESDSLFLVLTGRLRALTPAGAGGEIGVDETVGEIGVVSGEARIATVTALRDSQLLRIERDALLKVLDRSPQAWPEMTRVIVGRLRQNQREQQRAAAGLRSVAIVEVKAGSGRPECVRRLSAELSAVGQVRVIDADAVDAALGKGTSQARFEDPEPNQRLMDWLHEAEGGCDLLVYVAGPQPGPWLRRSLRQCDRILLVADAAETARASPVIDELASMGLTVPVELLLRRKAGAAGLHTQAWRELTGARAHYFWQPGRSQEFESIARQLTGRGVGLVLGGGGARGFAHIGLLRALDELGIPVDVAGGSSMGAFMAALCAQGLRPLEILATTRETFVDKNYLNDYMLPRVALIRGQRFLRRLREVFGTTRIEDLARPFFCVTTNLTRGEPMVHEEGPLALWVGASMSIPGIAPPVAYRGEFLADGGVVNGLPTDIMLGLQRGPIIASDVSTEGAIRAPGIEGPDPQALFHWTSPEPRPSLLDILFRTATLTSSSGTRARAERADIYLRMPTGGVGLFDWDALDEIVRTAYEFAMRELAPRRDCLLTPGLAPGPCLDKNPG